MAGTRDCVLLPQDIGGHDFDVFAASRRRFSLDGYRTEEDQEDHQRPPKMRVSDISLPSFGTMTRR